VQKYLIPTSKRTAPLLRTIRLITPKNNDVIFVTTTVLLLLALASTVTPDSESHGYDHIPLSDGCGKPSLTRLI
jgi:hypothetical protein